MNRIRTLLGAAVLTVALVGPVGIASAQATPPAVTVEQRAQLAAMTLTSDELPAGYVFAGETFLTAEQMAGPGIDAQALTDAGFVVQYVSEYRNADTGAMIRSYASQWNDAAAAQNGFSMVEDETKTNPDAQLKDGGADVGQDPRETTTGTYTANDTTYGTTDVTFRRESVLAGVAIDTSDGSAPDAQVAADLATKLDARVQQVEKGDAPAHTDLALPGQVVPFGAAGTTSQAGFLGPAEVESIYGLQGSVLDSVQASWVDTTVIGKGTVTVGVTRFDSEANASSAVKQSADLFTPLNNVEPVSDLTIDGASAVAGYRYTSGDGEDINSFRLIFSSGSTVTVIDLQNNVKGDLQKLATTIAGKQLGCQTDGACQPVALPTSFGT